MPWSVSAQPRATHQLAGRWRAGGSVSSGCDGPDMLAEQVGEALAKAGQYAIELGQARGGDRD